MRRVGDWLFNLRIKNKYTLEQASKITELPITKISHWESGLVPFDKSELDVFCILYRVNREYINTEIEKDRNYLDKKHLKNMFR